MFLQPFSGNCFVNYFALMRTNDANWKFCGLGTSGLLRAGNQLLFNEYCIHIPPTCQFVNATLSGLKSTWLYRCMLSSILSTVSKFTFIPAYVIIIIFGYRFPFIALSASYWSAINYIIQMDSHRSTVVYKIISLLLRHIRFEVTRHVQLINPYY